MSTLFDQAQRICRGDSLPPPVARLIGFTLTSIAPGHARMAFEAGAQHANPMGTLHGAMLCDIADAAMGMAYASTLGAGETFTTLELTINFLKPVWQARLHAIGRVVTRGRTIGLVECGIRDAHEALEERVRERTAALVVETAAVKRLALQDVPRLTRTAGHRAGFSPRAARRL